MQVQELMSTQVVSIAPEENAALAARLLHRHNIGILPVCSAGQRLQGVITDRDIVLRCVAAGLDPQRTRVRDLMSNHVVSVTPEEDARTAAALMGREQIRRLPVCRSGVLVGMLSLCDLTQGNAIEASEALCEISRNILRL